MLLAFILGVAGDARLIDSAKQPASASSPSNVKMSEVHNRTYACMLLG
jgi:hypothetical protein